MNDQWILATVRHGQTDFNAEKRYAGSIDVPLNEKGWADARNASGVISGYAFDVVITSTLVRAQQTVEGLFDGKMKPIVTGLACERNYGVMQGRTETEIEEIRPPVHFIKIGKDYHSVDPLNGETLEALHSRAGKLLDFVLGQYCGKNLLVVSHGQFLQEFHGAIRGQDWIDALKEPVRNLEMCVFSFADRKFISEARVSLVSTQQISW